MDNVILDFLLSSGKADERISKSVLKLLESLNYEADKTDGGLLYSCMMLVQNHIFNVCHISDIPDGLVELAARRAVGEFLKMKNAVGTLNIAELDLSAPVTEIREGDVSVSFAKGASDADKFNNLLNSLLSENEGDLICYRKIKW